MRKVTLALAVLFISGCASQIEQPPELRWRDVPEGYLQPCTLPEIPLSTAELSDAFVQAYKCGEIGNRDKQRSRELTPS